MTHTPTATEPTATPLLVLSPTPDRTGTAAFAAQVAEAVAATFTAQPSITPYPTYTPFPTATPRPTRTASPTATPGPLGLPAREEITRTAQAVTPTTTLTAIPTRTATGTPTTAPTIRPTATLPPVLFETVTLDEFGLTFRYPVGWEPPERATEYSAIGSPDGLSPDVFITFTRGEPEELALAGIVPSTDPEGALRDRLLGVEGEVGRLEHADMWPTWEAYGVNQGIGLRYWLIEYEDEWVLVGGVAPSGAFKTFDETILTPVLESLVIEEPPVQPTATPTLTPLPISPTTRPGELTATRRAEDASATATHATAFVSPTPSRTPRDVTRTPPPSPTYTPDRRATATQVAGRVTPTPVERATATLPATATRTIAAPTPNYPATATAIVRTATALAPTALPSATPLVPPGETVSLWRVEHPVAGLIYEAPAGWVRFNLGGPGSTEQGDLFYADPDDRDRARPLAPMLRVARQWDTGVDVRTPAEYLVEGLEFDAADVEPVPGLAFPAARVVTDEALEDVLLMAYALRLGDDDWLTVLLFVPGYPVEEARMLDMVLMRPILESFEVVEPQTGVRATWTPAVSRTPLPTATRPSATASPAFTRTPHPSPFEWKRYEGEALGFAFDVPEGWAPQVSEQGGQAAIAFYADPADAGGGAPSDLAIGIARGPGSALGLSEDASPEEALVTLLRVEAEAVEPVDDLGYPAARHHAPSVAVPSVITYALRLPDDDWLLLLVTAPGGGAVEWLDEALAQPVLRSLEPLEVPTSMTPAPPPEPTALDMGPDASPTPEPEATRTVTTLELTLVQHVSDVLGLAFEAPAGWAQDVVAENGFNAHLFYSNSTDLETGEPSAPALGIVRGTGAALDAHGAETPQAFLAVLAGVDADDIEPYTELDYPAARHALDQGGLASLLTVVHLGPDDWLVVTLAAPDEAAVERLDELIVIPLLRSLEVTGPVPIATESAADERPEAVPVPATEGPPPTFPPLPTLAPPR